MKSVQLITALALLCAAGGAFAAADNDWLIQPKATPQTSAPAPSAASGDAKGADASNQSAIVP